MRRREFLTAAAAYGTAVPLALAAKRLRAQSVPRRLSSYDDRVKRLLARMTLDEKIGQMTQAELTGLADDADVERHYLGSVLSGGNADPKAGNGLDAWTDAVDGLIRRSLGTRLGIPILYGADAVHGHNNVVGAVIFPHHIGMGCTRDAALITEAGRITALEMLATGVRWTFGPCVTVPRDERWGRTYEGFAENPDLVGRLGAAEIRGLQAGGLGAPDAVLACAKHYVGDGGTTYRERPKGGRGALLDQGDTEVDEATLRRIHLPPYEAAVAAGVGSIMVSYSSWNGVKCSASRRLLTEILKDELGFEGFLVSDYYAIRQIDSDYKAAVMQSINAGMDMAMEPARYAEFIGALKALVQDGRVPMTRIDDAVTRILRVKWAMGLMDAAARKLADRSLHASFGSDAHRAVARRAVRESLVLLKNEKQTLPLAKKLRRIHVAGRGADDIGIQCGGWTITWQGKPGATTRGTTLLAGIRAAVDKDTEVTYSADGAGAEGADAAVVVVGELPYAEGRGDRRDLTLSVADRELIARVAAGRAPLVAVVISGRPLILTAALEHIDALVAAWLPGSEGAGVADVLFGDHTPRGKLGFTWPRSMAQIPIHAGDSDYDPLYPFGFGLSYDGRSERA